MVRSALPELALRKLSWESRLRSYRRLVRVTKTRHQFHYGKPIPSAKLLPSASRPFERKILEEQSESKERGREREHNNRRQRLERIHAPLDKSGCETGVILYFYLNFWKYDIGFRVIKVWYLSDIWVIFEWYLSDIWVIFEWYWSE